MQLDGYGGREDPKAVSVIAALTPSALGGLGLRLLYFPVLPAFEGRAGMGGKEAGPGPGTHHKLCGL